MPDYPSASAEAVSEEQKSYLSDREADVSRTGEDAVSSYGESGQPEYRGENFSFRQPEPSGPSGGTRKADGSEQTKHRRTMHQHGNKYQQCFRKMSKVEEQPKPLP